MYEYDIPHIPILLCHLHTPGHHLVVFLDGGLMIICLDFPAQLPASRATHTTFFYTSDVNSRKGQSSLARLSHPPKLLLSTTFTLGDSCSGDFPARHLPCSSSWRLPRLVSFMPGIFRGRLSCLYLACVIRL